MATPPDNGAAAYNQNVIRSVQESLLLLGFQPGPIDGVFGARTRAAVRAYQREHGLREDGRLSDALVANILADGLLAQIAQSP